MADLDARADSVLSVLAGGGWPTEELHRLLDYLHVEVLRQIVDEEWLLFRTSHHQPHVLASLRQDHRQLRAAIDELTAAEHSPDHPPAQELISATRQLCTTLQTHLNAEEAALDGDAHAPSTSALGSQPHTVYALIEGPVIDLDTLPGSQGIDAALGRLLRLQAGEQIELHASSDPLPLWRRLAMSDPGGYGFSYLESGPTRWRAEITRRTAN
ncbi:MAG: DUF2249 domain-containing protein, partial [Jatrophihabitantaceae bacterium]